MYYTAEIAVFVLSTLSITLGCCKLLLKWVICLLGLESLGLSLLFFPKCKTIQSSCMFVIVFFGGLRLVRIKMLTGD